MTEGESDEMKQAKLTRLEKDMCKLAGLVWNLSKKHGGIYISASCCRGTAISGEDGKNSSATFGSRLTSVEYWGNRGEYTKNVIKDLDYQEETT